jgi:hypothetical protein
MWVLAVAAWVGVVIAGSGVTWVAIDRAGQQVTSESPGRVTQPAVIGTLGTAPTAPGTSAGTSPGTPSASPTTPTGPTPTRPATTGTTPRTSAPPAAHTETRTWSGAAGTVTVACTGGTARSRGASPSDGWHAEWGDSAGDEVEVKFEKGEVEVQVKATCVGGVPKFRVESGTEDD